jgi:hypothetical protein
LSLVAGMLPAAAPRERAPAPPGVQVVGRERLAQAMSSVSGYDLTATPNGARLQAEVLLRLAREALERDPEGPPLFIDHAAWYDAFLDRVGLPPQRAPLYARLAYENRQDTLVECRPGRVLEAAASDPPPRLALNVMTSWPDEPGALRSYSYDDTLSTPTLRVTCERAMSYRLVDYGDMVLYAEVRGLRGRPTSGALGVLFAVIGEASVVESRMAIAADGTQVALGHGRKGPFSAQAVVTVLPSGKADRGIPPGRPDLQALEARLRRPLKIRFLPATWPGG